jgi:hypothetical protein
MPRMPRKTKAGLKAQAYDLLGIDEYDVLASPKIEPMLKKSGMLEKVWDYLETSTDEMARKLIAQRYKLKTKTERAAVPFEAFCIAAELDTKRVLGMIVAEVYSQSQQAAELMAASAQPDVVQATIDRAVEPGGTKEREMLHKHSRFVPVPQTSITFAKEVGKIVGGDDNSQTLAVLPPIETTVRQLSDRFNERMLGAPARPAVDAEFQTTEDDDAEVD